MPVEMASDIMERFEPSRCAYYKKMEPRAPQPKEDLVLDISGLEAMLACGRKATICRDGKIIQIYPDRHEEVIGTYDQSKHWWDDGVINAMKVVEDAKNRGDYADEEEF